MFVVVVKLVDRREFSLSLGMLPLEAGNSLSYLSGIVALVITSILSSFANDLCNLLTFFFVKFKEVSFHQAPVSFVVVDEKWSQN